MQASDFHIGDRFHFPPHTHKAFMPDEIFTVEKVEDDGIVVQSNQSRWQGTPMVMMNVSLATYDERIRFLAEGETVEPVKRKKVLPGYVAPQPRKGSAADARAARSLKLTAGGKADLRHLIRKADEFVEALPMGEVIDFDALLEQSTVIETDSEKAA